MLVNYDDLENEHIKFISYNGRYPNLCSGVLTLEIDGKKVTFGPSYMKDIDYEKFWYSGGCITRDYSTKKGEWQIEVNSIPEQYRNYASEIDVIFNSNVPYGSCGGCI